MKKHMKCMAASKCPVETKAVLFHPNFIFFPFPFSSFSFQLSPLMLFSSWALVHSWHLLNADLAALAGRVLALLKGLIHVLICC